MTFKDKYLFSLEAKVQKAYEKDLEKIIALRELSDEEFEEKFLEEVCSPVSYHLNEFIPDPEEPCKKCGQLEDDGKCDECYSSL